MSADAIDEMDASLEDVGPVLPDAPETEVVHWMEKPPMKVGWLGLSATAVFAFSGWLPQREYLVTRRRDD